MYGETIRLHSKGLCRNRLRGFNDKQLKDVKNKVVLRIEPNLLENAYQKMIVKYSLKIRIRQCSEMGDVQKPAVIQDKVIQRRQ